MPPKVLDMSAALTGGLREETDFIRGITRLEGAHGCRITPYGASEYTDITLPFGLTGSDITAPGDDVVIAHPFPQLFVGRKHTLLCDSNAIYEVDTTGDPWTITKIETWAITTTGGERVTNGTFTGSAADWNTSAGWAYDSNNMKHTANKANINQGNVVVPGDLYRVSFDIVSLDDDADGGVWIELTTAGSGTGSDNNVTRKRYDVETHIEDVVADGANVFVWADATLQCHIDNVSVLAVGSAAISSDGVWHFADFGDMWFLHNGTTTVFRNPVNGVVYAANDPTIGTGCEENGRYITGNYDPTYWKARDTAIESLLVHEIGGDWYETGEDTSYAANFVSWSNVGGGDILGTNWFHAIINTDTYLDFLERNDSGFMPMPWQGEVLRVMQLGAGFMVYGDNGIAYMKRVVEPYPGYGMIELLKLGIADRGAAGGNNKQHRFVDTSGALWSIDGELNLQRLGYTEYFNPMVNNDITIEMDESRGDFYISDASNCFLLTSNGLSELPQIVNSVMYNVYAEGTVGVFESSGDSEFRLQSQTIDFGTRSIKTIMNVQLHTEDTSSMTIALKHRMTPSVGWSTTSYKTVTVEGVVTFMVSGAEFIVLVKKSAYSGVAVEGMTITWNISGKYGMKELI